MSFAKNTKLSIVDENTYKQITATNSTTSKPIKNSKFKKTRQTFDLFNFIKIKPKQKAKKQILRKTTAKLVTKKGKTREGGRRKHHTKLKKHILRYRAQKRNEEIVNIVVESLDGLNLNLQEDAKTNNETKDCSMQQASTAVNKIHSRRFREYCDNCTTSELAKLTDQLLRDLNRFQKRALAINEIKAKAHRRFVIGFRETRNYLQINKVKLIIIAPDCEQVPGEDGLDESISVIKNQCKELQVPYYFSLQRRQLAYALYKKVPISCIGILNYDGVREIFLELLNEIQKAKQAYTNLIESHNNLKT